MLQAGLNKRGTDDERASADMPPRELCARLEREGERKWRGSGGGRGAVEDAGTTGLQDCQPVSLLRVPRLGSAHSWGSPPYS